MYAAINFSGERIAKTLHSRAIVILLPCPRPPKDRYCRRPAEFSKIKSFRIKFLACNAQFLCNIAGVMGFHSGMPDVAELSTNLSTDFVDGSVNV
jgi:hypothetical protein